MTNAVSKYLTKRMMVELSVADRILIDTQVSSPYSFR
jgi:hypothetical protein